MSTVTKCDRCGTIFNPLAQTFEEIPKAKDLDNDAPWRLSLTKDRWPVSPVEMKIDLCPDCKASLNDWLHRVDEHGPASGRA